MSCARRESNHHHTNPKRQRWTRRRAPSLTLRANIDCGLRWGLEKLGFTELEGRFRDRCFCCARSDFAASERSLSPPCEGGVRGGEQGITNTFDRSGGPRPSAGAPAGSCRTRTAYQAMVPPGPPPLTPPSQGGETRNETGMNPRPVQDEIRGQEAKNSRPSRDRHETRPC
jgi:hypothetical protein